jgi:hypothetical protein
LRAGYAARGAARALAWLALILLLLLSMGFWAYLKVSLHNLWRSEAELPRATPDGRPRLGR